MGNGYTNTEDYPQGRRSGWRRDNQGRSNMGSGPYEGGYEEERSRREQHWNPSEGSYRMSDRDRGEYDQSYGSSGSQYGYDEQSRGESYGGGQEDFRSYGDYGSGRSRQGTGHSGGQGSYGSSDRERSGYGRGDHESERGYGRSERNYGEPQGYYGQGGRYSADDPNQQRGGRYGSQGSGFSGQFGSQESGSHRGKGPKGYKRSDERITEDINEKFSDDDHLDASNIEVSVESGEVTLSGEVTQRHAKRRAEDLAEDCSGVKQVQNNIKVKSSGEESDTGNGLASDSSSYSEKSKKASGSSS